MELPGLRIDFGEKPASVFSVSVDLGRFRVGLKGTLDLLIGVRIPASQFLHIKRVRDGGQCPAFFVFDECGGFCGDREGKTLFSGPSVTVTRSAPKSPLITSSTA